MDKIDKQLIEAVKSVVNPDIDTTDRDIIVSEYVQSYFVDTLNEGTVDADDIMEAFVELLETADAVMDFINEEQLAERTLPGRPSQRQWDAARNERGRRKRRREFKKGQSAEIKKQTGAKIKRGAKAVGTGIANIARGKVRKGATTAARGASDVVTGVARRVTGAGGKPKERTRARDAGRERSVANAPKPVYAVRPGQEFKGSAGHMYKGEMGKHERKTGYQPDNPEKMRAARLKDRLKAKKRGDKSAGRADTTLRTKDPDVAKGRAFKPG